MARDGEVCAINVGDFIATPKDGGQLMHIRSDTFPKEYTNAGVASSPETVRVDDQNGPSQTDVLGQWGAQLRREKRVYRKTRPMHAKRALESGAIIAHENGLATRETYEKGDFILVGSQGRYYRMRAREFEARYICARPEPASEVELAVAGFRQYKPSGKIWGHELTAEEASAHFPSGWFLGAWGGKVSEYSESELRIYANRTLPPQVFVKTGDIMAVPFPLGGEIYAIQKRLFDESYEPFDLEKYTPSEAEALAVWETALRDTAGVYCKHKHVYAAIAQTDGVLQNESDESTPPEEDLIGEYLATSHATREVAAVDCESQTDGPRAQLNETPEEAGLSRSIEMTTTASPCESSFSVLCAGEADNPETVITT